MSKQESSGDIQPPGGLRGSALALCGAAVLLAIVLAYSNHFHNSFHFDDSHTIVNNAFIRDLKNIPRFFTDGSTFSSIPSNQSYRPLVSLSLAIDYGLGGKLDPFYFQLSDFLAFLLQVALLGVVVHGLLDAGRKSSAWIAMLGAGLYGLHPANADTVNYIISRSDLFSTLAVLASFAVYMTMPGSRKLHLFVIPAALGILAKPPAAMFALLFAVYQVLFPGAWNQQATRGRRFFSYLMTVVPSVLVCGAVAVFVSHMTPKGWVAGASNAADYLRTQPYAAMLYAKTFLWPDDLSADYDLASITSFHDPRFWTGAAFSVGFTLCTLIASMFRRTRVIGFGLLWFVLALLPTSLLPLAEVMNDHRAFFPYVGLIIALAGVAGLKKKWSVAEGVAAGCAVAGIFCVSGYATYQRNKTWKDEESLWLDVSIKSPLNGRGLMNYGNTQMAKGDYKTALDYFHRAQKLTPYYPTLLINLAVAEGATGDAAAAEGHFAEAIRLAPASPDSYAFYARWLLDQSRNAEATAMIQKALALSPGNMMVNDLRDRAAREKTNPPQPAKETPESYLQASLTDYREKRYQDSIAAAEEALKLRPRYAEAWNNIGAACNQLGRYGDAVPALEKALALKPDFPLARNNLAYARKMAAQQSQKLP
jgi:Flp pilus assembly protein TadD